MARAMAMKFPSEFEKHWFRDLDKDFFVIWLLSFVILNTAAYFLSMRDIRVMTQEELKQYTEVIHRIKVEKTPVVKEVVATGTSDVQEVTEEEVEDAPEDTGPKTEMSAEAKQAVRDAKKDARREEQASRKAQIASKIKVLAAPTARGGRSRRGRDAAGGKSRAAALGLSGGGLSGSGGGLKGSLGIVSDASTGSKIQKIRGGGAIGDENIDLSGLNIGEALGSLSSNDMDLMLNEAPVELNQKAITAQGKASKSAQRSQAKISDVVVQNKNQVQYCYWRLKRRDSSLKGKVQARFTIEASGEVSRVKFKSQWSGNNPLGADVEKCIENVLKSWRFPEIPDSEGKVTAGATYIFE